MSKCSVIKMCLTSARMASCKRPADDAAKIGIRCEVSCPKQGPAKLMAQSRSGKLAELRLASDREDCLMSTAFSVKHTKKSV